MAFIRAALILLIALIASLFAVENMQEISIGIFPIESTLSAPVYLVVLAPLAAGLIVGWALARVSGGRAQSRRIRKEAARVREQSRPAPARGTLPAAF